MIAELLLFFITVIILVYFLWTRKYKHWEERGVPCLPAEFPWGSMKEVNPFNQYIGDFLQSLYKYFESLHENEPVVGFYGPNDPFLMIKDLDMVKSVFVSDFKSFHVNGQVIYASIDPILRYNPFLTQSMDEWKTLRGIHSPLFTPNRVKATVPRMIRLAKCMINFISDHSAENLNVNEITRNFALDVSLGVGFDIDNDSFEGNAQEQAPQIPLDTFFESGWSPNIASYCSIFIPWLALILRCRIVAKSAVNIARNWGNSLVEKRKLENRPRFDVIQRIVEKMEKDKQQNNTEMSDDVKTAQYMVLLLDGVETSSIALTFTLYEIARHGDVQEKLRREIFDAGNSIEDFDGDKIESMKYLDDCVTEALRLRTIVPMLTRRCTEDTTLGNLSISKGTKVVIPVQAFHRDPKYFPNPLNFEPERFALEDSTKHPAFYSFGGGPRMCLGMRHGRMVIKIALIAMLLKFKVYAVNDLELAPSFVFCAPMPLSLKFVPL